MTTVRERVIARLGALGAQPKRSLGQNFLISERAIERILLAARGSGPLPPAFVEVGPGLGSLTEGLLAMGAPLSLIELDREFAEAWRARGDVAVREADALRLDWRELNLPPGAVLVANLPYQISSSLAIERSLAPCNVERMVLMFQKEVGQRLLAQPKTAEYGLLTAIAQTFWDVRLVLEAGPRDFYPPPKVASRVLEFRARDPQAPGGAALDRALYLRFVKAAFAHRRKLMARNLAHGFFAGQDGAGARIAAALEKLGFVAGQTRAEELSPPAFVALFTSLTADQPSETLPDPAKCAVVGDGG